MRRAIKAALLILTVLLLTPNFWINAKEKPSLDIIYVGYCDLDEDGKSDDVYAEVFLTMFEGTNYLILEGTVKFQGTILNSIYRDNHVRTEQSILYKFYFYNTAYESGMYIFQVWFEIVNSENTVFLIDTQPFDPPGGDPDGPPGGGLDPGP